jgi:predicted nuclease with TOPRIM domain
MDKIDFDKLRKMPPERRVKALRELQEKLSELIKERSKEIDESKQEVTDAQEFLKEAEEELAVLEEMEAQAPGIKQVKVEELFEREKEKPEEKRLESIAEEAPRQEPSVEDQRAYINTLSRQPITSLYDRINQIRDDIRTTGVISAYQQEKLGQFREAIHEKEEAIRAGEYAAGRKAEHLLTAAERAIMYAAGPQHGNTFYRTRHENQ